MNHYQLSIEGMHCQACVKRVSQALSSVGNNVQVSLVPPLVKLEAQSLSLEAAQTAVAGVGKYQLSELRTLAAPAQNSQQNEKSFVETYKPLLLVLGFVLLTSALLQLRSGGGWQGLMLDFMAGFFLAFGFFKLLDVPAFARAYAGYDLIAARWRGWGYVYPFLEVALGFAYLARWQLPWVNLFTFALMAVSAVGVIQAVALKKKIQCACLGTGFNLPMSTVTVVEDLGMVAMAGLMLLW